MYVLVTRQYRHRNRFMLWVPVLMMVHYTGAWPIWPIHLTKLLIGQFILYSYFSYNKGIDPKFHIPIFEQTMQRFVCLFLIYSQWKYMFRHAGNYNTVCTCGGYCTYFHIFVYIFVIANENYCWKTQNMMIMSVEKCARAGGRIRLTKLRIAQFILYSYFSKSTCN